jgi:mannose-6-phosphate isomerase-like protein (cupin superfamily)
MTDIEQYIQSGMLEEYVLGLLPPTEMAALEAAAAAQPPLRAAIDEVAAQFENFAKANEVHPNPTVKPFLMATIDYMERMAHGETPAIPPLLSETSEINDFAGWLKRADMQAPATDEDLFARIIGHNASVLTAIVWIKTMAPQEVHDDTYEKFLVVEGSCTIAIGQLTHHLEPGDFLSIPLHQPHVVTVTSACACKVILQRVAA